MEVSEREYAQLRIEHISYQHGLSVIIRLLENDAKVKDVIIIARGILKLYPNLVEGLLKDDSSKKEVYRKPDKINGEVLLVKEKILFHIKEGIHRSYRLRLLSCAARPDDFRNAISLLIGENLIERTGAGSGMRYNLKRNEFFYQLLCVS